MITSNSFIEETTKPIDFESSLSNLPTPKKTFMASKRALSFLCKLIKKQGRT
jgi:hypothetical protein